MLNTLPVSPQARQPRGIVRLNGQDIPGWVEWEVDNNCFYQADTFRVTFAASGLPADRPASWLLSQADLSVELLAGLPADPTRFDASDLTSYIIGRVDEATFDPVAGVIELVGRDYTSQFIDAMTTEKFNNKRPDQIAQILAARHDMTANVEPVQGLAGRFYQIDHATLTDERTEWDLLTWLANQCQYDVWVSGTTLNFLPKVDPEKNDRYVLRWEQPVQDRAHPVANVTRLKLAQPARPKGSKIKRNTKIPYGQAQTFTYTIPGLTHEQALARAQAIHTDKSRHQLRLEAERPADAILSTRTLVQLEGTGTVFDQVFYPESVVRGLNIRTGFTMRLTAKNHPVESTVSI